MKHNIDQRLIGSLTFAGRFDRNAKVKIKSGDMYDGETGVVTSAEDTGTTVNSVLVDDPTVEIEFRKPIEFHDNELDNA